MLAVLIVISTEVAHSIRVRASSVEIFEDPAVIQTIFSRSGRFKYCIISFKSTWGAMSDPIMYLFDILTPKFFVTCKCLHSRLFQPLPAYPPV
jgi:hypothetical protein